MEAEGQEMGSIHGMGSFAQSSRLTSATPSSVS